MRVARIAGIPIRLHWSFIALMVGYAIYAVWSGGLSMAAFTMGLAAALFGSVILHELGHAMAARSFGIQTAHITLYPFGGVAAIAGMPARPWQELVVALAGPGVNFVLASVLGAAWMLIGVEALLWFSLLNVLMGLFNLIPAFPMDGGRVLRALLAGPLGYVSASRVALFVGRAFAWVFLGVGLTTWSPGLVLVALFLHVAVTAERRRLEWALEQAALEDWRRQQAMPPWRLASQVAEPPVP